MMMRAAKLLMVVVCALPSQVAAQAVGFGARAGTLGLGGEAALDLGSQIVLRGGIGFSPFDPSVTLSDVDVSLSLPTVYNVGLDLYLNSAFRIGGGVLFRRGDVELTGEFDTQQEIGGSTFTPDEIGTLTGVLDARGRAPYVLIGFGRHTAMGAGLFIDLGIAFTGDPLVSLGAEGGSRDPATDTTLRNALDQEADDFEDDMRGYLKLWPVLSLGVRLGPY